MDHLLDPWYGWLPLRITTALTPLTVALRGTELVEFSDIWTWHKKSCRKSLQCQALKCWVLLADDQLIMRCRLYLLEEIFPLGRKIPLGSLSESSLGRLHCSYRYHLSHLGSCGLCPALLHARQGSVAPQQPSCWHKQKELLSSSWQGHPSSPVLTCYQTLSPLIQRVLSFQG